MAIAAAACSLDWTVRPAVGDAGPDAPPTSDAGVVDSPGPIDATPKEDAADADCAALAAAITTARSEARRCALAAGECVTKVKDECDCELFVARPIGERRTDDFRDAVSAFLASCNPSGCPSCPFLPVQGTCLATGGANSCSP
ncbi:MAG: hypothetical protein KF819_03810 [Labilithrix sp.]|nr:hypothetical protein [Labilithrix sp.]